MRMHAARAAWLQLGHYYYYSIVSLRTPMADVGADDERLCDK